MLSTVWGPDLAPLVSTLIIQRPVLARRLALAPRRVVHALAAYAFYALEARHEVEQIGRAIEEESVRSLLARVLPNPHPRLYRLLDRVGPMVLGLSFYRHLDSVLHGPAADAILEAEEVTAYHLDVAIEVVADPVLLAARKAIKSSPSDLQHVQNALRFLRITGLAVDVEALPPGSGWRAILRRISSDLGRARAPEIGFEVPPGWQHVESVADLWRIGTAMGNCVSSLTSGGDDHIENLMSGDAVYLTREATPAMLACIRRVGPQLWTLTETGTYRPDADIVAVREALQAALSSSLSKVGGALLERSPLSSMRSIAWRGSRDKDAEVEVDDLEGVE